MPSVREDFGAVDEPVPVDELSPDLLRYTLPSRYCDSDRLMDFAFEKFGTVPHGLRRVQAICDWVHKNIEYRFGSGSPYTAASEIIAQGFGVCRDFAHCAVALSRCFNIPTRYVTGYVPDVACYDPGTPMDFHAYMEVYINHRWHTFDARFNVPRIGRIKIACGLDAVDGAFSTLYGAATLSTFFVWAYQVDPAAGQSGRPDRHGEAPRQCPKSCASRLACTRRGTGPESEGFSSRKDTKGHERRSCPRITRITRMVLKSFA